MIKGAWKSRKEHDEVIIDYLMKHRKKLAQIVFQREKTTSNDYKKIDKAIEECENFIVFMDSNTDFYQMEEIDALFLISFLQEYILSDKSEVVPNKFYRYRGEDQKSVHVEIHQGKDAFRKNQFVWVSKVVRRYNVNRGKSEIYVEEKKSEYLLDSILMNVYQSNSLYEMHAKAEILLFYIRTFIENRGIVIKRCNELIDLLKDKKYCLSAMEERQLMIFMGSIEKDQYENFICEILHRISSVEKVDREYQLEYLYDVRSLIIMGEMQKGCLEIIINPARKEVIFEGQAFITLN